MIYDPVRIGACIRENRVKMGITQESLAHSVKTYQSVISNLENGNFKVVRFSLVLDIVNFLNLSIYDIFKPEDEYEDDGALFLTLLDNWAHLTPKDKISTVRITTALALMPDD